MIPDLSVDGVDVHVANIARDGYSIMHNAIEPQLLAALHDEIERLQQVRPGGDIPPGPFTGYVTRRWFDLLNDADIWQDVAVHPWIMQILPQVLGDGFLLSTMGTAVVGHDESAQAVHVDDSVYSFPRPHPNLVCNTMWALTDFTEATGATRVVPGSQDFEHDPALTEAYDTEALLMPAGSIALVLGSCYHGAGANTSGEDRIALTINYCNGCMRQQENLMLGIHPSRMLSFAPELQDLLGFKTSVGAGHIFAQDPRLEMQRHYADQSTHDNYLDRRNDLHNERTGAKT